MPILLDQAPATISSNSTLAEAVAWAQAQVPAGRVITHLELDGEPLNGSAVNNSCPLGSRTLSIVTRSRNDLALTTIGKLAAMIEWLSPQHKDVARMLEQGNSATALARLGEILSAWQQIQGTYAGLAKLLGITMSELTVRDLGSRGGEIVLNEFCNQLSEMHSALKTQDLVLLADILQYEMDGAVANWMALLEATLAIVEPCAGDVNHREPQS